MTAPPSLPFDLPSLRRRHAKPRLRLLVFVDPEGAFAATAARPRAFLAMAIVCAFALLPPAAFLLSVQEVGGLRAVLLDEMKKSGTWEKLQALPTEQREAALDAAVPAMGIGLPVGAASKRVGWLLFVAVTCFFLLRHTSSRPIRLGDVVGVVAVGAAPLLVHDVVTAASLLVWDLRSIDPQNAVMSNPSALFFDGRASRGSLALLLRGVDVFELWACWLMGLGVVRLTHTRSFSPWLVTFGGHIGLTVLGALTAKAAG